MNYQFKDIWRRLFFVQLLLLTISINLKAQKKILEQKISLSVQEEKLEDVFSKVSAKTETYFSYNSDLISERQRFTLDAKEQPLYQVLDKLLLGTSLHYKVIKKQIIIYKKVKDKLKPKVKISFFGTVRDALTKEAISGVNVFVSGTMKGNPTDKFGNFSIDGLFPEAYELVFSHVSYDIRLLHVNANYNKPTSFNVILFPKTVQLDEIEINSTKDKDWAKHYYLFESEFLGNTLNASQCEIINSESINLVFNKKKESLKASSEEPLLIDNNGLGYIIQYYLQSFENDYSKSIIHGVLSFKEKTPSSKKELRQWKRNRKNAYYGSYAHFLKALYSNRLRKEGFNVYLLRKITDSNTKKITERELLYEREKGYEVKMKFDGYLKVDYIKAGALSENKIINEYYQSENTTQNGIQTSYLKLNLPNVTILRNGLIKEQFSVTKYGYWSWERVAEYLPFEYKP